MSYKMLGTKALVEIIEDKKDGEIVSSERERLVKGQVIASVVKDLGKGEKIWFHIDTAIPFKDLYIIEEEDILLIEE